ncbi:GSCOCG00004915001-RA-CDS [Cotesia congregata]|nr:GSCOCG00004915001-RA-CDS [Cotesia congregata]
MSSSDADSFYVWRFHTIDKSLIFIRCYYHSENPCHDFRRAHKNKCSWEQKKGNEIY